MELKEEIERTGKEIREEYLNQNSGGRNRPFAELLAGTMQDRSLSGAPPT